MLKLETLNTTFNELWLHTEQLPILLDQWQEMVGEYLSGLGDNKSELEDFEKYMNVWKGVLEENKLLLELYQDKIKERLKIGDLDLKKQGQTKKYQ